MAYGFQSLKKALYFGFIVGTEKLIARRRHLAALDAGRKQLTPKLLIRNTINEGFAGAAAKVAKEALPGIDPAGINESDPPLIGKRKMHNKWRHARSAVEPQNLVPRDDAPA